MSGIDNEREVAFWLKQCLKGQAEPYYSEVSDLNKLWENLETRFGDHLLVQRYLHVLPNRKRQSNESLADLSSDIRRMSDIVYDGVPFAQKERLAIQHFLSALNDPQASYDVSCKKPETLEMALHRYLFFGATLDNGSCLSCPSFIHGQPAGSHMGNPGPISQWRPLEMGHLHGHTIRVITEYIHSQIHANQIQALMKIHTYLLADNYIIAINAAVTQILGTTMTHKMAISNH